MKTIYSMTLTAHEKAEFSRCAQAMYQRGANAQGHLLSALAAKSEVPTQHYDLAAKVYRAWLTFNEVTEA